jgi:flagellar FliJ protein
MSTIESLLNLKRWSEDEAKHMFALRLKELAIEEKRLFDLEEQYMDTDARFESASNELIDVDEIKRLNEYLGHILVRIRRQREVISLKEMRVEEARKMLQEASKEKKTFEKLDEKQKNQLREDARKKEQIGTDEHAGMRHARKTGDRQ